PFTKYRRYRRIQILRLDVSRRPTAERDRPSLDIVDRKDHPLHEAVAIAALVLQHQPDLFRVRQRYPLAAKMLQQPIPAGRGKAEAKLCDRLRRQAAPRQIRLDGRGLLQLPVKEPLGEDVGLEE